VANDVLENDGTQAVDEHPEEIEEQGEPPTYGPNNCYLPEQLQNAIKIAIETQVGARELYDRRRQVMRVARNKYYRRGFQHIYENRQTGMYVAAVAGEAVAAGGGMIECPQYVGDYNIVRPTELVIESVLTQNPPGIDFRPDTQVTEDLEAAKTAEVYREFFDRANDVKGLQLKLVQSFCESGLTLITVNTEANEQLWGLNDDGEPKQNETARVWGALEARVLPLTANCLDEVDAVILYDDRTVNSLKQEYPHISKKVKSMTSGLGEDAYARIARLGILQGTRRYAQVGDALTHLGVRANAYLRPCCFVDEKFDDAYQLAGKTDDYEADKPEDNENEDGKPFTVRDKLNQLFPSGVHAVFVGKTFAEAWDESVDDGVVIGFPYEGDGMAREAIMDDAIVIQDFFNDIMNSLREAQDYGWPRTFIHAEDQEFDAIQDQKSEPYAFSMKKARNGQPLENDFFREPDLVLPQSLSELSQYLAGPFLQFVLGTPPALFGASMEDQKTASGYAQAKNQAMGVKGIPWSSVQWMMARMYYLAALKASKNPDHAEQILVPVKGQTQILKLERLTKGKFGAYPDEDSSFPETTSAKRDLLQQLLTIAGTNPTIGAQILGDTYNWETIFQTYGFKELQIMEAECAKKQMREIEELLQGQPLPPTPQELQAFEQQQQQAMQQHAAATLIAQQSGQPAPSMPDPPKMIDFGPGQDGQDVSYPESLLKPSIDVDDLDFHQWEGPAGQDWLSTEACWREINVGRPGPDGEAVPNTLGVENVRLHVKLHLQRAAIMAQAQQASKPPTESINFADESPAGQAAMNKQAGIQTPPSAPAAPTT
jgi:hypothetical protein